MKHIALVVGMLANALIAQAADIYGIKSKSLGSSGPYQYEPPAILFRYPDTGAAPALVGTIRTAASTELHADGLAHDSGSGMWFFEPSGPGGAIESTLRPLDMLTAVAGDGLSITGRHVFGAAFDPSGRLWAMDQEEDELIRVDTGTGQILESVGLVFDGNPYNLVSGGGDMAFDASGQAWIVDLDAFYQVDLSSGIMTNIHTHGGIPLYIVGAAFSGSDPSQLHVFDVSFLWNNDDLLMFDTDDGFSRTDVALVIFDWFNAGRGDLASVEATEPISLSIAGSSNVVVTWPQTPGNWTLYETPSLGTGTVSWSVIEPPYATGATSYIHTVGTPVSNQFFRLQLP